MEGTKKKRKGGSHFYTNPYKTRKQPKNDISKQLSKQAKTGEVERNYKMFANPVFITPGGYIL